jgi:ABC-2 type transport system ATP-binding protein
MNNANALSVRGLVKEFDGIVAVRNLDLDVPTGGIFGLLGPNGSGKTTTIRTALGLYLPDGGTIDLLGASDPRSVRARVGYLPEERGLYPKMQVQEQLAFLGAIRGLSHAEANKRAAQWLERMGLGDRAKSQTNEFSKGMQQKVQFAAAVIHAPELVVLDEPFSGLDPVNTRLLQELILEQRDRGCTVILSSHRMEQVEQMCDGIGLIHRGELVLNGQLSDIKARYGRGTLAIEYAGSAADLEGLPGVSHVSDSGRSARLQMEPGADAQAIIRSLLDRVTVDSFRNEEPSVEDIFLEMVGATSTAAAAAEHAPTSSQEMGA